MGFDPFAHFIAIHARHHDIQQNQIWGLVFQKSQGAGPALGDENLVTRVSQGIDEHANIDGRIIDDEDVWLAA